MLSGAAALGFLAYRTSAGAAVEEPNPTSDPTSTSSDTVTLFLCGDVMTGRGIDQILPHPGSPRICESYMDSALGYVELAEKANGPIPRPVDFSYIWGDALEELERRHPAPRIINLETSVTTSEDCTDKGIGYRMSPANVPCLTAASIDCCVLANNHMLDWGRLGLVETLATLKKAGLKTAGAGGKISEAEAPAIMELAENRRVTVFSFGFDSSGIPRDWAASETKPGVNLPMDYSDGTARHIGAAIRRVKRPGDIVVASVHWGGNWGYEIAPDQRRFAHKLIDDARADIVHGHSSHHAKGIEVYRDKPILYGCGDFLTDYEGIAGYEEFRDDLALMYFPTLDPRNGKLVSFDMTLLQIRNFRLRHASREDARWLRDRLDREGASLGTRVELGGDNRLTLRWH